MILSIVLDLKEIGRYLRHPADDRAFVAGHLARGEGRKIVEKVFDTSQHLMYLRPPLLRMKSTISASERRKSGDFRSLKTEEKRVSS